MTNYFDQETDAPSPEFITQVKDALEHLYDFPYLQYHPLAQGIGLAATGRAQSTGQQLRSELVAAIESLSPGPSVAFRAPHARLYNLLQLRYVEGMTVHEASHELGLSERQGYRDLKRGEESIAAILRARHLPEAPFVEPGAASLSSIQAEMARLETKHRPADIGLLLRQAQKSIERLASSRAIRLSVDLPAEPVRIATDPALAQQILVHVLSQAVQQARPGELAIHLEGTGADAVLTLRYVTDERSSHGTPIDQVLTELLDRLCWKAEQIDQGSSVAHMVLTVKAQGPTVLVIDDNEGLVQLLDRFLTSHTCRVVAATNSTEGLKLARQVQPAAIVLDVMMPGMDGWELLQRLRAHPRTVKTPIIVCSVFNDPELAYSLGASLFLPKPVKRIDILEALRQLDVV